MIDVVPHHEILCAGYPETGKTTFLVALWHVVKSNEVNGSLKLDRFYEGHREYIDARYQEWLEYKKVKRTPHDFDEPILLTLKRANDDRILRLAIPDLSGETFRSHFEERRYTESYRDRVRNCCGLALFIHPNKIRDPTTIEDADAGIAEWGDNGERGDRGGDGAGDNTPTISEEQTEHVPESNVQPEEAAQEFTLKSCCTQVQLVDLLQFLIEDVETKPLRIAVVVSALDELSGTNHEDQPDKFICERVPLLDQYLKALPELYEWQVYGVSAQGARYDDSGRTKLQSFVSAAERVRVVAENCTDHDITRPLRWLAFGQE